MRETKEVTRPPWAWRCRYEFHKHAADAGLDADCENIEAGRIELADASGRTVIAAWGDRADDLGVTVSRQDALLLAAAPELLAALESLEAFGVLTPHDTDDGGQDTPDGAAAARREARLALAKAKGGA